MSRLRRPRLPPLLRPDKAEKYLKQAIYQAWLHSKDPSTKVGALILEPRSFDVVSTGYNGMPRGVEEVRYPERWDRPRKYLFVEHAERNALYNASRHGKRTRGCWMVASMFPCADCARGILNAGLVGIISVAPKLDCDRWGAHHEVAIEMFKEAGVRLQLFETAPDPFDLGFDPPSPRLQQLKEGAGLWVPEELRIRTASSEKKVVTNKPATKKGSSSKKSPRGSTRSRRSATGKR